MSELRHARLEAALAELGQTIEYQGSVEGASPDALEIARGTLAGARAAFDDGKEEVAWAHLHQSFRFLLQSLTPAHLEAHRKALRAEAAEKLANWRRVAVLDILDEPGDVRPESLALAQFLMDQHFANVYFKLDAAALRFGNLLWALAPAVVGLLVMSALSPAPGPDPPSSILRRPDVLGNVMLAGATGALLSGALSQMGLGVRIPDFLTSVAGWLVRPFLGAISAVILCMLVQGNLLPLEAGTEMALYAWAVAAGFSDQLVSSVMRGVEESARK